MNDELNLTNEDDDMVGNPDEEEKDGAAGTPADDEDEDEDEDETV